MYVVFEGIDGSGKTSTLEVVRNTLHKNNFYVNTVREPGSNYVGEDIRNILFTYSDLQPMAKYLLFAAARVELNEWIKGYDFILSDRSIFSSLAYQGVDGLSERFMLDVFYESGLKLPDIVYWFNLTAEKAIKNNLTSVKKELNHYDKLKIEYLENINTRYKNLAKRYSFIEVDATKSIEDISDFICKDLFRRLNVER